MLKSPPRPWTIGRRMRPTDPSNGAFWKRGMPRFMRWLHIYLSMVSFGVVFFFSVTGLTLNHAEKFGGSVHTKEEKGALNVAWVNPSDTNKVAKLDIVEFLRSHYKISAPVSDFRIDDAQVSVSFKGPGYEADAFVDRQTGAYQIQQTTAGFVGIINDLHKGRDTGSAWSVFIDVAGIFLATVCLTGLVLLLYLKRRRAAGLIVASLGIALVYLIYVIWVK